MRGFTAENAVMLSRLKEGQGPDYRSLTVECGHGNGTVEACGNVNEVEGPQEPWRGVSGVASRVA